MTIDELKKMLAEAVNSSKKQDEQNLIDLLYCYRQSGDEDRYMVMMDIVIKLHYRIYNDISSLYNKIDL